MRPLSTQKSGPSHSPPGGETVLLPFNAYWVQVLEFADEVEAFYQRSAPKEMPADAQNAKGHYLF